MKKEYYVTITFDYDDIVVKAENHEEAIEEAKRLIRSGGIEPNFTLPSAVVLGEVEE